jgi:hypothetical protein
MLNLSVISVEVYLEACDPGTGTTTPRGPVEAEVGRCVCSIRNR